MLGLFLAAALSFQSGDVRLSARLFAPPGRDRYPVVVMVQGSGDERATESISTKILADTFNKAGIGLLAYDKRGTGESGGKFTGSDFRLLGADAAAAARFAHTLKGAGDVGFWGISQADWIIPYALESKPGVRFGILVSPPGVNPFEQVEYFMARQVRSWGLSEADAAKADALHRATSLYYAGQDGYVTAKRLAETYRDEPWFKKVVSHPYWHTMPDGKLMTPQELAHAVAKDPGEYEMLRSRSSFENYAPLYKSIDVPVLLVYGSKDELIPVQKSREILEPALKRADVRLIDGADHNMQTDGVVRKDYLEMIVKWVKKQ